MNNLLTQTAHETAQLVGSAYWLLHDNQRLITDSIDNKFKTNLKDNFITNTTKLVAHTLKPTDLSFKTKELERVFNKHKQEIEKDWHPIYLDIAVQPHRLLPSEHFKQGSQERGVDYGIRTTIYKDGTLGDSAHLSHFISKKGAPAYFKMFEKSIDRESHNFILFHEIGHLVFSKQVKSINTGNKKIDNQLNFLFDNLNSGHRLNNSSQEKLHLPSLYNESFAEAFAGLNLIQDSNSDNQKNAREVINKMQHFREAYRHIGGYQLLSHDISISNKLVLEKSTDESIKNLSLNETTELANSIAGKSFLHSIQNYQGKFSDLNNLTDMLIAQTYQSIFKSQRGINVIDSNTPLSQRGFHYNVDLSIDKFINNPDNAKDFEKLKKLFGNSLSSSDNKLKDTILRKLLTHVFNDLKSNGTLNKYEEAITTVQAEIDTLNKDKQFDLNDATFPAQIGNKLRDAHEKDGTACKLKSSKYIFKGVFDNSSLCEPSLSTQLVDKIKTVVSSKDSKAPLSTPDTIDSNISLKNR